MSRELLKQALEQLKRTRWASNCEAGYSNDPVIAAIEAELAKPEQENEPTAWVTDEFAITYTAEVAQRWRDKGWKVVPFYTAPPRKPWMSLGNEQIQLMAHNDEKGDWSDLRFRSCWHNGYVDGVNAANDKLKELNT